MKRCLVVLVALFFIFGCVSGLANLKTTDTPDEAMAKLMVEVQKCPVDEHGWRTFEIPDKDFANNHIKFVVFKSDRSGNYGIGVTNGMEPIALIYIVASQQWFQVAFAPVLVEQDQADELIGEWVKLLFEHGDLSKAGPWQDYLVAEQI